MAIKRQWIQSATVAIDDATGELLVRLAGSVTVKRAKIDASAGGDNELVATVDGKKICLLGVLLLAKEAVDATLYSGAQATGAPLTGALPLAENEGFVLEAPSSPEMHWIETEAGKKLNLYLSAAAQVSGCLVYYEEA